MSQYRQVNAATQCQPAEQHSTEEIGEPLPERLPHDIETNGASARSRREIIADHRRHTRVHDSLAHAYPKPCREKRTESRRHPAHSGHHGPDTDADRYQPFAVPTIENDPNGRAE